jgi:uncharacterized protein (TIGR04255 family)
MLAQVNISPIAAIADFVPQLQEVFRQDFPEYKSVNVQCHIELPTKTITDFVNQQWHFLDKEASTGILFDSNIIIVHTNRYKGFVDIIEIIKGVLNKFNEKLKISSYKRLGLRYVNVVQNDIDDYLKKEFLGFPLPTNELELYVNKFLTKTEKIQEFKQGSTIKIQSTYVGKDILRTDVNNLVPLDLAQTAGILSFPQEKQPKDDFLILDIDHFIEQQLLPYKDFAVDNIIAAFDDLHEVVDEVFYSAITKKAVQDWS